MSVEKLITDHIDIWSSALQTRSTAGRGSNGKIDLYGIKKLRELILELAVRGKLVPQDPNDEPASELLKRIAAEKAELVKQGKIKKQKPLPEIREDEKPFELPEGWEWIRLGDATINRDSERIPLSSDERSNRQGIYDYYGASGVIDKIDNFLFDKTLLLIGEDGANLINRTTPIAFMAHGKYWVNNHAHVLDGVCVSFLEYICLYINSISLEQYITGTAQPKMNQAKMNTILLGLAPKREQSRILSKVNILMSLCDQLEQQSLTSLDAHQQLVETLLASLTDSQNAEELAENWARISQHFDTLFTTEASIDALKQTILQLAVMGKLVPQDPNDEPASELLKRIEQEKAQLVKEGKIKNQKPLPPVSDKEKPFELPKGWEWCKLQNITSKVTDGDHKTPARTNSGYKLLSAKNVRDGYIDYNNCDYIAEADYLKSRERCLPEVGDLLIVSVGGTIGRSSLIKENANFALVRSVAIIKPLLFNSNYLKFSMDSLLLQKVIHETKRGGAQPCLYLSEISNFLFPMPPEKEQKRIVSKIEHLLSICARLKSRLQSAQQTQLHLADALTDAALN